MSDWPAYLALAERGELLRRAAAAEGLLDPCRLCPRRCGVHRLRGEVGACGVGPEALVASFGPHFGEEGPLVGLGGSGTIFFAGCNLTCLFCQNAAISHGRDGERVTASELARLMGELQRAGCANINLVTPTHQVPQILRALTLAAEADVRLPLVYNCGGYESLETLAILGGIVDIYMPDVKYADEAVGRRLSGVERYPEVAEAAVREMHRQVGDLVMDAHGGARRGLLVRHLVLPDGLAGTDRVVRFLAALSRDTYVNIMGQYHPCHRAHEEPPLARRPTAKEMSEALRLARAAGLRRLDGYC